MEPSINCRSVGAGRGTAWVTEAFSLFMQSPWIWIALLVVILVAMFAIELIPLGGMLGSLFSPVIYGGLMLGCEAQRRGEPLKFETLFAGFRAPHFNRLLVLGVIYLIIMMLFLLLMALVLGGSFGLSMLTGSEPDMSTVTPLMLIGLLLVVAAGVPVAMAMWFAVPLAVLGGLDPVSAIKASFRGCLVNIVPFLIYGLVTLAAGIVAVIPLGLGLLIFMPVMTITIYTGYRDIFAVEDESL